MMKPNFGPINLGNANGGRQSLGIGAGGNGENRRLSVYNKGGGVTNDPRPIKDKAFIKKSTQVLIDYLGSHGYDRSSLTLSAFESPTARLFVSVSEFLFQQIDPSFVMKKVEEDMPLYLAKVRYPFRISKGTLLSPGSPHTWPPLLAVLVWLVEMLTLAEAMDSFDTMEEKENENNNNAKEGKGELINKNKEKEMESKASADSDRAVLDWFSQLYSVWLSGEEDGTAIDQTIQERFRAKEEESRKNVQTYTKANEQLKAEIQRQSALPTVDDLNAKKQQLKDEIDRHQQLVEATQTHKALLLKKYNDSESTCQELSLKLEKDKKHLDELKLTLSKQSISCEEVEKMRHSEETLSAAIDKMNATIAEQKATIYSKTCDLRDNYKKLSASVAEYNSMMAKLNSKDTVAYTKIDLNFNEHIQDEVLRSNKACLSNRNLRDVIQWSNSYNKSLEEKLYTKKRSMEELKMQVEKSIDDYSKKKGEQTRSKERMEIEVAELKKLEKDLEILEMTQMKDIQQIELQALSASTTDLSEQITTLQRKIKDRSKEKEKIQQECKKFSEEGTKIVLETISTISNHRKHKREQLLEMKHSLLRRQEEIHCYEMKEC